MKVLAIQRAEQFSPNSVEKDNAIMEAVVSRLRRQGHEVSVVREGADCLSHVASSSCLSAIPSDSSDTFPLIITMSRLPETLEWLKLQQGSRVINSAEGIARCARKEIDALMRRIGTPMPPTEGADGYWLKRGDMAAQTKDDVQYAADHQDLEEKKSQMQARGITDIVVSAHVKGDLVKFYGVLGTGFFRCFYPTDDGGSKFGDEALNGKAHHYAFQTACLHQQADQLAAQAGILVYGGDCIVRADGTYCVIDFNDWPSFSRCREEAADAIVKRVMMEMEECNEKSR